MNRPHYFCLDGMTPLTSSLGSSISPLKKRKPSHPGEILDDLYIKPLHLNLQKLADRLGIARNTLFKIRTGLASVTPAIALSLAEAFDTTPQLWVTFDTTPQLWVNLQTNYDLWIEAQEHERVRPIVKNGELLPSERNIQIAASQRSHE